MSLLMDISFARTSLDVSKNQLSPVWVLFIFLCGISIRLINYFNNAGLWLDEALLSLNLLDKSLIELLYPLDYNQVAPVLFLVIEKFNVIIFGPGEMALRLFPFLCSLASLPLFYHVAKEWLKDKRPVLTAFFIFALAPIQLRYSAEVKQYMTDEFVLLALFWLFQIFWRKRNVKSIVWLGISGMVSIFLSHIAVFVLFTFGIFWLIAAFRSTQISSSMVAVLSLWAIAFSVSYFFFIYNHGSEAFMLSYWTDNFLPLNPFSGAFWHFMNTKGIRTLFDFLLYNHKGLPDNIHYFIMLGFVGLYLSGLLMLLARRKYSLLYFLGFPVFIHLFLSGIHKYPFNTRLSLYLSPLIIMTIAYGLDHILKLLRKTFKKPWVDNILLGMILVLIPYKLMVNFPVRIDGARDCMQFINKNYKEGQVVYVPYFTHAPFEYYRKTGRLVFGNVIIPGKGLGSQADWDADLEILKGQKGEIWLLFSHLYAQSDPIHKNMIKELKKQGDIKLSFQSKVSAAYLIDLGP